MQLYIFEHKQLSHTAITTAIAQIGLEIQTACKHTAVAHKFIMKLTAFCDLRIRLATFRKSVRKFWFCKLALTRVDLRFRLTRALEIILCFVSFY